MKWSSMESMMVVAKDTLCVKTHIKETQEKGRPCGQLSNMDDT